MRHSIYMAPFTNAQQMELNMAAVRDRIWGSAKPRRSANTVTRAIAPIGAPGSASINWGRRADDHWYANLSAELLAAAVIAGRHIADVMAEAWRGMYGRGNRGGRRERFRGSETA